MSENIKIAWIGALGTVVAAIIGATVIIVPNGSNELEKITVNAWFCVVSPSTYENPYGACDTNRGDKQVDAGKTNTVLVPIEPKLIPGGAKVEEKVQVTGADNFHLFKKIEAKYENGHIKAFVTPNETGGFNDKLTFTVLYSR